MHLPGHAARPDPRACSILAVGPGWPAAADRSLPTAAITVAEGNKQSAILNAEGDRQAAILRAEGFALALTKIFEAAQNVDAKTMSLQYLEALKQIGASPSTKFVIPMEFTNLLSGITDYAEQTFGNGKAGA